ncbi:MAG: hypothetical protein HY445_03125 [Candidatus Niyogibacteria bacterium]|nr:hypothetical protein [Candidatus Niyogibacteria bacterium]
MKNIGLRFMGKIPEGKFEITCVCGHYEYGPRLISAGQVLSCPQCGAEYQIIQQITHWHLFITLPKSSAQREGPVCPVCYSQNIEYLCDHWLCHDCGWKTLKRQYVIELPRDVNPSENICCDYGGDND